MGKENLQQQSNKITANKWKVVIVKTRDGKNWKFMQKYAKARCQLQLLQGSVVTKINI